MSSTSFRWQLTMLPPRVRINSRAKSTNPKYRWGEQIRLARSMCTPKAGRSMAESSRWYSSMELGSIQGMGSSA